MRALPCWPLLLALLVAGCVPPQNVRTGVRNADFGPGLREVYLHRAWLRDEPGRGLLVDVRLSTPADDYRPDLEAEFDRAAQVLRALAADAAVREWDYVELRLVNRYDPRPPGDPVVSGTCRILMRGTTLRDLHQRDAPASAYPAYWRVLDARKDWRAAP